MQALKEIGKTAVLLAIVLVVGIPSAYLIVDRGGPLFVILVMAGPWALTGTMAFFSTLALSTSERYAKHASIMFNIAVCAFGMVVVSIVGAIELWYTMQ